MSAWQSIEARLSDALRLTRRPVAVAFRVEPPAGVAQFLGTEPSGCSFWRLAAQGRAFYTVPGDHYNCPVGSYTHNVPLPPERATELDQVLGLMTDVGYLRMEEVPGIPRLPATPAAVVYAPLGEMPVEPDVVLLSGPPGRIMLLQEAAIRAGVAAPLPLLARPTCMALPAALTSGVVVSTGCIGNRVYTDVGDDELYVVIPGKDLATLADALDIVTAANAQLADYHRGRRLQLASD
jgi:uncharacterized protein (DUF169 family)